MKMSPIVLFTYNRPQHTKKTIDALKRNELAKDSDLIIFSDSFKNEFDQLNVEQVRKYLSEIDGFRSTTILFREKNWGLASNIIDGINQIMDKYDRAIILEDDLLTSPFFLKFMNESLQMYEDDTKVISVQSYVYPVKRELPFTFFLLDPGCLGWGTWRDRWALFEPNGEKLLEGLIEKKLTKAFDYDRSFPFTKMLIQQINKKNSSWAIRWYATAMLNEILTLYPGKSLIFHMGSDGSGTHAGLSNDLDVELSDQSIKIVRQEIAINIEARKAFKSYFRSVRRNYFRRGVKKLLKIINPGL